MNRLADLLHYLNASGDKAQDATRFWFDTRANLRREMNDRRGRFDEPQVRVRIPTGPAKHSNVKPATCTDLKPAACSDLMSATS